jgi:two-component system, OmpR family, sensor histidine kinase KdpD
MAKFRRLALQVSAALGVVAALTFVFFDLIRINATTAGFFYLVAILMIATSWGLFESTVASVVAMLCFNYFFFPPVGTFTVADPQNWIALFAFLATALTGSQLSARLKRQKQQAEDRRLEMERLYALSRALLLVDSTLPAAKQIANQIAQAFDFSAVAIYDRSTGTVDRAGPDNLADIDLKLREAVLQSTVILDKSGDLTITPIRLGGEPIGSLAISSAALSDAALQSILNLVAIGMERARAQAAVNRAEVSRQSEALKSTLLDAVAHEFKSPLTSIKAVTTDLLDQTPGLPPQQKELIAIADQGVDRLERLVSEAIQLARIEGGKFGLNKGVHFPSSLIAAAIRQMKPLTEGREIRLQAPDDLPLVLVDAELIEMVIRQLLDNALKYAPAAPITITAQAKQDAIIISVADQGPGIAEHDQARIFDKFYRSSASGAQVKGTGMGLAIAREILRAHDCDIWVQSEPGAGAEFSFSLPLAPPERLS